MQGPQILESVLVNQDDLTLAAPERIPNADPNFLRTPVMKHPQLLNVPVRNAIRKCARIKRAKKNNVIPLLLDGNSSPRWHTDGDIRAGGQSPGRSALTFKAG